MSATAKNILASLSQRRNEFERMNKTIPTEDELDSLIDVFGEDSISEVLSRRGKKERSKERQIEFLASALVSAQRQIDELRVREAAEKRTEGVNGLLNMLFRDEPNLAPNFEREDK